MHESVSDVSRCRRQGDSQHMRARDVVRCQQVTRGRVSRWQGDTAPVPVAACPRSSILVLSPVPRFALQIGSKGKDHHPATAHPGNPYPRPPLTPKFFTAFRESRLYITPESLARHSPWKSTSHRSPSRGRRRRTAPKPRRGSPAEPRSSISPATDTVGGPFSSESSKPKKGSDALALPL
jgi:hypothetical protein